MKTAILTTILSFLLTFMQLGAQQTIYSCGFETWTGGYPDGWGGPGTTISPDSVEPYTYNPHTGAYSCRFINWESNADTLYSVSGLNFIKGHKYRLSYWVKGRGTITVKSGEFNLYVVAFDSLTWQQKTHTIVALQDFVNAKILIKIGKTWSDYQDLQFDDILIEDFGIYSIKLDTNNISATINANGNLFYDLSTMSGFEAPKASGRHSIFTEGFWFGGFDSLDSLHLAAILYSSGSDYQNGPVADDYSLQSYISKYHRLWKVNKSEIDYHISNYGNVGYVMPEAIAFWPGNGDTINGEAYKLAPFADLNGNGLYDPQQGEYPFIRGDQAVYFILNDDFQHSQTYSRGFGIEKHAMAYSYNQPSDSALFNTVFLVYKIINRSDTSYHDVYAGLWADMDLGSYNDDFHGCDSALNFFFIYNGDDSDGDGTGVTYGEHPPAQGTMLLNHPLSSFMAYGGGVSAQNYYYSMTARWPDGTHLTYGGNGVGGAVPSNYLFGGTLYSGWSEISENNTPGERRSIGATGPFTLQPGGDICIEMAFPFARDYNGTAFSSAQLLRQRVQDVKLFFDNQNFDCLNTPFSAPELAESKTNITVYPNPSEGCYWFRHDSKQNFQLSVYNTFGQCVLSQVIKDNNTKADISNEAGGIFLYRINDVMGRIVKTGKLVKIQ